MTRDLHYGCKGLCFALDAGLVAGCNPKIVAGLQVEPKLSFDTEYAFKAQRRVRAHRPVARANLINPSLRHAHGFRYPVARDAVGLNEILGEHRAWMHGLELASGRNVGEIQLANIFTIDRHHHSLVVVNNLYVPRMPILPAKANSPLLIDADTPLPFALTFERLQAVAGWVAQRLNRDGCVDQHKLAPRDILHCRRQAANFDPLKNRGGGFVGEAFNHRENSNTLRYYCQVFERVAA